MECTKQIEAFEYWLKINDLAPMSQLLWYKLLALSNKAETQEYISIRNCDLMKLMQIKREATFITIRDNLIKNNLIRFQKGKKGMINCYQIYNFKTNTFDNTQNLEEFDMGKIKKTMIQECIEVINEHTKDLDLRTALNEYLCMRDAKKKPPTIHAMKLVLGKLSKYDTATQVLMVNNSIINGWTDVYEIKLQANHIKKMNNYTYKMHEYTEDELNCFTKY